jgi:hypothetical protein
VYTPVANFLGFRFLVGYCIGWLLHRWDAGRQNIGWLSSANSGGESLVKQTPNVAVNPAIGSVIEFGPFSSAAANRKIELQAMFSF